MKNKFLFVLLGLGIVVAGCVATVDGNNAAGLPLIKDRIQAEMLLVAIGDPENGFLRWLQKYW